jgi:hypothetical protein
MKIGWLIIFTILCFTIFNDDAITANLCDRLSEIREMPFKNEKVDDEVYNGLLKMGSTAIPCLINKLTDTTRMRDPRKTVPYSYLTVGDVAFFVILDISGEPIERFLPERIWKEYEEQGIYAYFRFVENSENRKLLQDNLLNWFSAEYERRK